MLQAVDFKIRQVNWPHQKQTCWMKEQAGKYNKVIKKKKSSPNKIANSEKGWNKMDHLFFKFLDFRVKDSQQNLVLKYLLFSLETI